MVTNLNEAYYRGLSPQGRNLEFERLVQLIPQQLSAPTILQPTSLSGFIEDINEVVDRLRGEEHRRSVSVLKDVAAVRIRTLLSLSEATSWFCWSYGDEFDEYFDIGINSDERAKHILFNIPSSLVDNGAGIFTHEGAQELEPVAYQWFREEYRYLMSIKGDLEETPEDTLKWWRFRGSGIRIIRIFQKDEILQRLNRWREEYRAKFNADITSNL